MPLESTSHPCASDPSVEALARLRARLDQLRDFHRNAISMLDRMNEGQPKVVPRQVRVKVSAFQRKLEDALGPRPDPESELTALERSIDELRKQLSAASDICRSQEHSSSDFRSLEAFRKLDSALLSPISILDFLLAEAAQSAANRRRRSRDRRAS